MQKLMSLITFLLKLDSQIRIDFNHKVSLYVLLEMEYLKIRVLPGGTDITTNKIINHEMTFFIASYNIYPEIPNKPLMVSTLTTIVEKLSRTQIYTATSNKQAVIEQIESKIATVFKLTSPSDINKNYIFSIKPILLQVDVKNENPRTSTNYS